MNFASSRTHNGPLNPFPTRRTAAFSQPQLLILAAALFVSSFSFAYVFSLSDDAFLADATAAMPVITWEKTAPQVETAASRMIDQVTTIKESQFRTGGFMSIPRFPAGWHDWDEAPHLMPGSIAGNLHPNGTWFAFGHVDLRFFPEDLEALAAYVLDAWLEEQHSENITWTEVSHGPASGIEARGKGQLAAVTGDYVFRAVKEKTFIYMTCVLVEEDAVVDREESFAGTFGLFNIQESTPMPFPSNESDYLTGVSMGEVLLGAVDELAIAALTEQDTNRALELYKSAYYDGARELHNLEAACGLAAIQSGPQAALELWDKLHEGSSPVLKSAQEYRSTHEELLYRASLQLRAGQVEEALAAAEEYSITTNADGSKGPNRDLAIYFVESCFAHLTDRDDPAVASIFRFITDQQSREGKPDSELFWMKVHANLLFAAEQPEQAVATLKKIRESYPDDRETNINLIDVLVALKEYPEAIEITEDMIARSSEKDTEARAEALYFNGLIHFRARNLKAAREAIDEAINLAPDSQQIGVLFEELNPPTEGPNA